VPLTAVPPNRSTAEPQYRRTAVPLNRSTADRRVLAGLVLAFIGASHRPLLSLWAAVLGFAVVLGAVVLLLVWPRLLGRPAASRPA
jgi:O-antigen/teichoic acid export membrane protein